LQNQRRLRSITFHKSSPPIELNSLTLILRDKFLLRPATPFSLELISAVLFTACHSFRALIRFSLDRLPVWLSWREREQVASHLNFPFSYQWSCMA